MIRSVAFNTTRSISVSVQIPVAVDPLALEEVTIFLFFGCIAPLHSRTWCAMAKERRRGSRRNDDATRRECLQELHARLEVALAEGDLTAEQRQDYRDSFHDVLSRMTTRAVQRIHANVKGCRFYRTHDELTAAFKAKYPEARVSKVLKGAFDRDGFLHLEGGGILYGRPAPIGEFYGHELATPSMAWTTSFRPATNGSRSGKRKSSIRISAAKTQKRNRRRAGRSSARWFSAARYRLRTSRTFSPIL
jgi:hypothetical protein